MSLIRRFFHAWERRLAIADDPERKILPFDWGAKDLGNGDDPAREARQVLHEHARDALAKSHSYFQPDEVSNLKVEENEVWFETPLPSVYEQNNTAHGVLFPASPRGPAVVILPQWNARGGAHDGLCRLLNLYGMSALKLSLPYHGPRKPEGLTRADYALSPNLGRTLHSCRQAVQEARVAVSWLIEQGYGPVGIVGTSLGSCISFIAFAHDPRIEAGVFNHISPYFADVVWRGLSTRHIREGLEGHLGLDELRELWLPISPQAYVHRLAGGSRFSLLIWARFDLSFPPDLSHQLVEEFDRLDAPYERYVLPCGHYTTAKFPFNFIDGFAIARFLKRQLRNSTANERK
jgi:hypothetical protein